MSPRTATKKIAKRNTGQKANKEKPTKSTRMLRSSSVVTPAGGDNKRNKKNNHHGKESLSDDNMVSKTWC